MSAFVKFFILTVLSAALVPPASAQHRNNNVSPARSPAEDRDQVALEGDVLRFRLTDANLRPFLDVAAYRQSSRLEVLPGFPEPPSLDASISRLGEDAGTRQRLVRGNLAPRDYMLTGWALVLARDPGEWGIEGERLTPQMRQNIAFVRLHAGAIDALLLGE